MGAVFRQEFYRTGYDEFKSWICRAGAQVVGASPAAPTTHFGFAFKKPCVIALGNERLGLSSQLKKLCTEFVRIPMAPGIDSLNVSVAGSLLLYEVARASRQGTSIEYDRTKARLL
jgi:TrmH family RNA methyltransferase